MFGHGKRTQFQTSGVFLVEYKAGQEPLRGFLGSCPALLCLCQLCHQSPECHSPLWLFQAGIAALDMFSSFSKAPEEGGTLEE